MKFYMVGGAVRDKCLGITPKDFDYVIVGATEEDETNMLNEGFKQVGESFPVYLHPITGDEYAFARTERKTAPGHQGFSVETAGVTLEQDLSRRDLTINSMAIDMVTKELFDPFNGQQDLKDGIIRHTTEAFAEDPLRIFRAAKFMSRYGFSVAPETEKLMVQIVEAGEVAHLAKERINAEIFAILQGTDPELAFHMLHQVGALTYFSPMIDCAYNVSRRIINAILNCKNQSPEDRIGFLLGLLTGAKVNKPSDADFRKEMVDMKLPISTMKMAMTLKNVGFFEDFFTCSEEDALLKMKLMGFTVRDSKFPNQYFGFIKEYLNNYQSDYQSGFTPDYITKVWSRCVSYMAMLNVIDREQISVKAGPNGKVIAAAILAAEIDTIKCVDKHYAKYSDITSLQWRRS